MASFDEQDWNRPVMGSGARDTVLERRSVIWNDNAVVAPTAPPLAFTGDIYWGKFFTRGCRGKLDFLQIYCMRTAAGTLDLSFSPHPCIGPLYTLTVTPGAAWAWAAATFFQMWNYDSLFIWVSRCDADVSYGRDGLQPFDGHQSLDTGATWQSRGIRIFIRINMFGETPGDVPVSGILNIIPIPSASSSRAKEEEEVPVDVETDIVTIEGAGYCDFMELYIEAANGSHNTSWTVYCDGVRAFRHAYSWLSLVGYLANTPTLSLLTYAVDDICLMLLHKRFEFRRELRVTAHHPLQPQTVWAYVYPTLLE